MSSRLAILVSGLVLGPACMGLGIILALRALNGASSWTGISDAAVGAVLLVAGLVALVKATKIDWVPGERAKTPSLPQVPGPQRADKESLDIEQLVRWHEAVESRAPADSRVPWESPVLEEPKAPRGFRAPAGRGAPADSIESDLWEETAPKPDPSDPFGRG